MTGPEAVSDGHRPGTAAKIRGGRGCGLLARGAAACNNADLRGPGGKPVGDPTEIALLELAAGHGAAVVLAGRQARRRQLFRFDPRLKLMTTVDDEDGCLVVNTKGAPEEVLARVTRIHRGGRDDAITAADRDEAARVTDTLPALALSRESAEPGLMDRPPRPRAQGVISRSMLARAWGFLGLISAALVMTGFYLTLRHAGWHPGAATGPGTELNHAYRQAATVTWLGIVACQVGTAFAVRTSHASLRSVGLFSNRYLLGAIAIALAFAAALIYTPALNSVFGTAPLTGPQLATVAPFPFIVWGADELRRFLLRRPGAAHGAAPTRPDATTPMLASPPAPGPSPA
jgi:magnesium-transporting ATPase (P-type)